MKQINLVYVCENCGEESSKWSGRCSNCGQWNSLVEMRGLNKKNKAARGDLASPISINAIGIGNFINISTGLGEFDRVIGGGIVPGSLLLLAGDPGIGKSTLLLMVAERMKEVLYVSGEESCEQIKLRADRLKVKNGDIKVLAETNVNYICELISKDKPALVVVDSIQAMYDENFPSTPGSIVQVRECALKLQRVAKTLHIPIVLVGHATKDGSVAGPRTLEHLVDAVFYLEGDRFKETRILRGIKNRFGPTDEIGIFAMEGSGLKEILNPSELFLEERVGSSGSVVTATMEGSRPFLVEIQALTATTVFGYPRRTASGFDANRLQLLLAVLTNKAKLQLQNQDVYINVVGGFQLKEPAVDLAVAMAVVSSFHNKAIDSKLCVFGEIGLSGEIRNVPQADKRKKEAKRLGFTEMTHVRNVHDVINLLFK
ncbi:MAG: DNA repair protein RadA [bacterium]|nr:DNA repair protein RadA [bacterium]